MFQYCPTQEGYKGLDTRRKRQRGTRENSCNLTREPTVSGNSLHPQIIIVKCGAPDNEWTQVLIV